MTLSARPGNGGEAPGGAPAGRRHRWWVLLVLFLAVLALQAVAGALTAELASPDEPAHFVSGLMVRDYLASGLSTPPLEYASSYYAHYPKIAIGNWPPLFYAVEGVWLLLLPALPASVLVLLALLTALLGTLVFESLRPLLGTAFAGFGAGLLILLRPVQLHAGSVMLEIVLAVACVLAVLLWARFLTHGGARLAAAFAAVAVVAVLIKANALFLLLVPPLTIVLGRRWHVLRARGLWLAVVAVLLLVGPWTWYSLEQVRTGWQDLLPTRDYVLTALRTYSASLLRPFGIAGIALALIGAWQRLVRARREAAPDRALWDTLAALILAVIGFHTLVPAGIGYRHLLPAYPAVAMFAAAGAYQVAGWLRGRGVRATTATAAVLAIVVAAFAIDRFRIPFRTTAGYRAAARAVVEHGAAGQPTTSLIVSDAVGEGAFTVEVAIRDRQRPSHVVWRGTNLLSLNTWAGRRYRLRAADDAGVLHLLEQASVRYIVIDRSLRTRHQQQLERAMAAVPERFAHVADLPLQRDTLRFARGLSVYEVRPAAGGVRAPGIRQVPGYDGVAAAPHD